jgi:hypothetical protein
MVEHGQAFGFIEDLGMTGSGNKKTRSAAGSF